MIRKIFLLGAVATLIMSCDNRNAQNQNTTEHTDTITATTVYPADNVSTTNDISNLEGSYTGTIPCADCEGIRTHIRFNRDNTYTLTTQYMGKGDGKIQERTGRYTWDQNTGKIVLDRDNLSYRYRNGQLSQLDQSGNDISGNLASNYVLVKQTDDKVKFENEQGDKLKIKDKGDEVKVKETDSDGNVQKQTIQK